MRPTNALLLLYLLNVRTKAPKSEPTGTPRDEPTAPREEEPTTPREEEAVRPAGEGNAQSSGRGKQGEFEAFEDGQSNTSTTGETASTATGKSVHKTQADIRRASGEWSEVNTPITDKSGNIIRVPKRVNLKTGEPQPDSPLQEAIPDAVNYNKRLILDDKPIGRPIAKDRQEIIRFIKAYQIREGVLPERIVIQRYDPVTGQPTHTEIYTPDDFLP